MEIATAENSQRLDVKRSKHLGEVAGGRFVLLKLKTNYEILGHVISSRREWSSTEGEIGDSGERDAECQ